ncbi:MAG TPA: S41 family peptidase, partial [Planctomycetaceae bacterium]|nr:S41 family peptidase [Planctomycetaceae bacterium]
EHLERSRRWLDAIQYYEKALKRFPNDEDLKLGLRRAKIHFGIERRYSDRSFRSTLLAMPRYQLMALADDVLLKIKSHFVENLSFTTLVAHGTESFYYSLANESFLERNLPPPRSDAERERQRNQIRQMRDILRTHYWNKPVSGRDAALHTIRTVADTGQRVMGLPEQCVVLEYIFGFCNALDDYSDFLTPDRLSDLYDTIDGNFVGIGIEMKAERGKGMLLVNVLRGSPAEEGGARPGDHIVAINGIDCREMTTDEAANLLRGPAGSRVRITLVGPDGADVRHAVLVRRHVEVKSIPVAEIIDREAGIGYIRMTGFQKSTPRELDAALVRLQRQGMRALIWDLRGNPGGLLTAAVEVLDRFIDHGVLVSTRGRTLDQNLTYSAHRGGTINVPLVLLVDSDSASASEIVAGAIHDYGRGVLVGRTTYGKWSVQSIFPVRDSTGLRLTTARFYSPRGHTFGEIGLAPDVAVDRPTQYVVRYRPVGGEDPTEDPDIRKGLEILRSRR